MAAAVSRRVDAADAAPAPAASGALAGGTGPSDSPSGSDRYDRRGALGQGSSATVWRAYDRKERKDVAIKEFEDWEGCTTQYNREISTLKALNAADTAGNHVLRMLDAFVPNNNKPCIVMEVRARARGAAGGGSESAPAGRARARAERAGRAAA
jgi:hypothetical protein